MLDLSTDRARCGPTSSVTSFRGMDEFSRLLSDAAGRAAHYRATVADAPVAGPVDEERARGRGSVGRCRRARRRREVVVDRLVAAAEPGLVASDRSALLRLRDRRVVAGVDGGRRADLRLGPERLHRRACRPRPARPRPRPAPGSRSCSASRPRRRAGSSPAPRRRTRSGWPPAGTTCSPPPAGTSPATACTARRGCGSSRTPSGTPPSTGRCGCSGSATATSSSSTPTPTARSTVDALRGVLDGRPDGPVIVCLQSGNVNTGACDDLRAACEAVHERRWLGARRRRVRAVGGGQPGVPAPQRRRRAGGLVEHRRAQVAQRPVRRGVRDGVPPGRALGRDVVHRAVPDDLDRRPRDG